MPPQQVPLRWLTGRSASSLQYGWQMDASHEPLKLPVTRRRLSALASSGLITSQQLGKALSASGLRPQPGDWVRYVYRHGLALGGLLLAVGLGFFVAANWGQLSLLSRLGVVALPLALGTLAAGILGPSVAGRSSAAFGALLFGPLLAVYGQTFQTGADSWELFRSWTGIVVLYAAVFRSRELGVVALLLAHVTTFTLIDQWHGARPFEEAAPVTTAVAMIDAILAVLAARFLRDRWRVLERSAAILSLGLLLPFGVLAAIFELKLEASPGFIAYLALTAAIFWISAWRRPDVPLLALNAAALICTTTSFVGHLLLERGDGEYFALFLLGVVLVVQVWGAAMAFSLVRARIAQEVGR